MKKLLLALALILSISLGAQNKDAEKAIKDLEKAQKDADNPRKQLIQQHGLRCQTPMPLFMMHR